MTAEQAGKPAGICDCCGKLGYLSSGPIISFLAGQNEMWCEDCRHAIKPKDDDDE